MYGMRFAQIAQDMCNYLDAQTKDLAPNEALVAKKMIIRKLCRGEGLDDMIAPQSALSTKRKQPAGPNVARSVLITLDIGHCRLAAALAFGVEEEKRDTAADRMLMAAYLGRP